jgi:NhaA family Na+:H+ antiporter
MTPSSSQRRHPVRFLFENSIFLIAGAILALIWANMSPDVRDADGEISHHGSYNRFVHFAVLGADTAHQPANDLPAVTPAARPVKRNSWVGSLYHKLIERPDKDGTTHGLTIHFIVNDLLMALFFGIAASEVWEALLPGGALSNPRKAATPLIATLGGIVGPAGIYLAGAGLTGTLPELGSGWAIPCATDIAFAYLIARLIFGQGHPAIAFLLLLAIADDAVGLAILAIFYPQKSIVLGWFLLTFAAILICFLMRRLRLHSFWWYLLVPGTLSWISFDLAGIHAALGLVPIIPCLPHAHTDLGLFARQELSRSDTLNEFVHWWKNPVELILGLFSLINAGVVFSSIGTGTWLVLAGLMIGKPVGIVLFTWISEKGLGLEVPEGMSYRHVVMVGVIAAIGFTVALFVSTAAFKEPGPLQDSVKMGALLSFMAAGVALAIAPLLGLRPGQHESADRDAAENDEDPTEPPSIDPADVPAI